MSNKIIYLDNAATTPMDRRVIDAMAPYFSDKFYNPSANYLPAKEVASDIANARGLIAHHLGSKPSEVIFTAGGTEANNLAINGIMQNYPDSNLVVSAIEHDSILEPAKLYNHKLAPVRSNGVIDVTKLEKLINDSTVLVSIIYANNEIGTVQPLKQVGEMITKIRKSRKTAGNDTPLYFHSDACQTPSYLDLHVDRLGVDMMTLNSGKIYGPKQQGALYVKRGIAIKAQILGGGQELNLRSGTENPANIIGFAKALDLVQSNRKDESNRLQKLQSYFIDELRLKIPDLAVNGSVKNRLPNNVHVTIARQDNERLLFKLDELGILCAAGSACSAKKATLSPTLIAIGLTEVEARSSLRFSMGRNTTKNDLVKTVKILSEIL